MEEESFELLSSMSPKVKHCQKHFRKGTTVLALRRSFQKTSIHDKSVHTEKIDELIVTEASSSSTSESSISKSTKSYEKLMNTTPISIHDSDSEDESKLTLNKCKPPIVTKHVEETSTRKSEKDLLLSKNKFEDIQHWIDDVNLQSELKDCTRFSAYSELSTIYGDENNKNFMGQKTGQAINSTVIGPTYVHFEDLFRQKTEFVPRGNFKNNDDDQVINESYIQHDRIEKKCIERNTVFTINDSTNSEKSIISSSSKGRNLKHSNTEDSENEEDIINNSDNSFSLNESLNTRLKNKNQIVISTAKNKVLSNTCEEEYLNSNFETNENEVASMLDEFYGNKWREKEELVLPKTPKTEPKKRMPKPNDLYITNSERKPKLSVLYKNPYSETEKSKSINLLRTLQKSRLKSNMESIQRLNDLCDSDTDSDIAVSKTKPRERLNFDDSDCDDDTTSKYFKDTVGSNKKNVPETESKKASESDKENLEDFSFLGQSLEERIRKKINGIKDISGEKKKGKKSSQNNKGLLTKRLDADSNKIDKKTDNTNKKREQVKNKKLSSSSSDDTWEEEISKIVHESKPVDGKYSFLASLSGNVPILQCDMSARMYRNSFKQYKEHLLSKLFKLYNEEVFENAIPHDTTLEWNDRMRGTAGFCYCKKTRRTGAVERTARIVLSTKVIDAPYRLRDTLIHEMCHAATWIVNCVSDGHGPYWKSWACKAMRTFPELPPIKRCHDYVINTKYTYKCTQCGYSIGRHSKSLDIERKRCGYCLGKFEVLLNKVTKKGETKSVPATPKKEATGFALFVKENYSVYRQTDLKHGDVMKLLGQKFQEMKVKAS